MNLDYSITDQSLAALNDPSLMVLFNKRLHELERQDIDRQKQRQIGLESLGYDRTVKQAEAQAAQSKMSLPGYFDQINRGSMGNAQSSEAAGQLAIDPEIIASKKRAALSENYDKADESEQNRIINVGNDVAIRLQSVEHNPILLQQTAQQLQQKYPVLQELWPDLTKPGVSKQIYNYVSDLTKRRLASDPKHQGRMAEIGAQGANQIATANIYASARSGGNSPEALDLKKQEARRKQLNTLKDVYTRQLENMSPKDPNRVQVQSDLAEVANELKSHNNPQPSVTTLEEVRRLYPGKPDDVLKAAYKQKYGVDLK